MKRLLPYVIMCCTMLACTKEDQVSLNNQRIPIQISCNQISRANDSTYETNDEVGIFVVNYTNGNPGSLAVSGNQADNERFTYNNGAWTPDETIYWKDQSTAADFYAYYPYSESVNISAHPFSVMADQSNEDNFWTSDFLWGKAANVTPTSAAVPIVTNHSLSRIIVNVKPGNGFTEEAWAAATKSVKVCDVVTSATIDLSTGTATATGDKGEIIPLSTDGVYKAMLVPQEVADNSKLVVVTVDGVDYVYRKGYTFKRNTQHTFTITVNKKGGNVDVAIGEWEMDDFVNIGNAEEEEATIPNNEIWYTASAKVVPTEKRFGATIKSNEWDSTTGKGVITFNGDVTKIGEEAFFDTSLTSIVLPNSVISIDDDAFNNCGKLTSVVIPENVISIGERAFSFCYKLTSVTIPDNVISIGIDAFRSCSLSAFYGKYASDDNRCLIVDGVLKGIASADMTSYTIPGSVTSIEGQIFYANSKLTTITIPESVTSIDVGAFWMCSSLSSVYCKRVTPPILLDSNVFYGSASGLKIYVPKESVDEYKSADGWSDYADCIVGYDF